MAAGANAALRAGPCSSVLRQQVIELIRLLPRLDMITPHRCRKISHDLIDVKDPLLRFGILPRNQKEVGMPIDSILVSAAVVSMFVIFAGALFWADFQTAQVRHETADGSRKRRPF
jgi:hypothetical protein